MRIGSFIKEANNRNGVSSLVEPTPDGKLNRQSSMTKKNRRKSSSHGVTRRSSGGGMVRFQQQQRQSLIVGTSIDTKLETETLSKGGVGNVSFHFDGTESSASIGSLSNDSPSSLRKLIVCCFCFHRKRLRSRISLRSQIMMPFGVLSFLIILLIVLTAIWTTLQARDNVVNVVSDQLDVWAKHNLGLTSRFISDVISQKSMKLEGLLGLVQTMTQERFAGYPSADDAHVPFPNYLQQLQQQHQQQNSNSSDIPKSYPWVAATLLPFPSQLRPHVTADNCEEHLGSINRYSWYATADNVLSTEHAMMVSSSSPSSTTSSFPFIHRKVSDYISPLAKSLFEYHNEVKSIEIHFVNDGFGDASVVFPARSDWALTPADTNGSEGGAVGCEWLRLPSPHDASRPILDQAQRANCARSSAKNNVLQHDWCRMQALHPLEHQVDGPYLEDGFWQIRMGKAIYDTISNELIACTTVVINALSFEDLGIDASFRLVQEAEGYSAIVRWSDHSVVAAAGDAAYLNSKSKIYARDLIVELDDAILEAVKDQFVDDYNTNNRTLREAAFIHKGRYVSLFPSPPPCQTVTGRWIPEYLNIVSLSLSASDDQAEALREELDPHTNTLIRTISIVGFGAAVAILLIIYLVAKFLTMPLEWMKSVGKQVLESAGSNQNYISDVVSGISGNSGGNNGGEANQKEPIDLSHTPWWYKVSPRTEVTELVRQFRTMVQQFSGQGTAKLFKQQLLEVKNPFVLFETYRSLYDRRLNTRSSYTYNPHSIGTDSATASGSEDSEVSPLNPVEKGMRIHEGPNVYSLDVPSDQFDFTPGTEKTYPRGRGLHCILLKSPLFWWIFCWIAVPLIVFMLGLSVYVIYDISDTFPRLVDIAGELYAGLERDFLEPFTRTRAAYMREIVSTAMRDLHVFSRIAGWLFTGAIPMANDTFVSVSMTAEQCKTFNAFSNQCAPGIKEKENCDCDWRDPWGETCYEFAGSQRSNQMLSIEGLREDALPNGDRDSTTFPALATSPQSTQFWPNVESLPGFNSTQQSKLPDTSYSYDRARVMAALSAIQIPLYNYVLQGYHPLQRLWGTHFAADRGGLLSSYAGCNVRHSYYSHVSYGRSGGRARGRVSLRQELCPDGKFGLDPRCGTWYDFTRRNALNADVSPIYLSPPRRVTRTTPLPLSTLSLPVIDSRNNELLGGTMGRFSEEMVLQTLSDTRTPLGFGSFHLLTLAGEYAQEDDVLLAPGFEYGDDPVPISEILLRNDSCSDDEKNAFAESCQHLAHFQAIVDDMHDGGTDLKTFQRTSPETGKPEWVTLTYAPVRVRSFRPIDSSDFSRGSREFSTEILSVAMGQTEDGISLKFESVRESLDGTLERFVIVLLIIAVVALVVLIPVSAWLSMSIAVPASQLCRLVDDINRFDTNTEFPEVAEGSSEVSEVRSTFERLYKLVRVANISFFLGEIDKAYLITNDALVLFTKLDNSKARGIASNNLGNVMLTMYRTMKKTNVPTLCDFSRTKIIHKGCRYFNAAINLGEEALKNTHDEEGFSVNYLIFMQQVSNRYFNRAMFLLTVRRDHPNPEEAKAQGMTDLLTCKDMDREVVDNGDHEGFKGDKDMYFELLMGRIKGLLLLMKMGYKDPWGIEEIFDEARDALETALATPDHPLFDHLGPAGQMQRLDSALIDYHIHKADQTDSDSTKTEHVRKASQIAVRMMMEDDYVIGEAAVLALKALIDASHVSTEKDFGGEDPSDVRSKLFQNRQHVTEILSLSYRSNDLVERECFNASNLGDFSMEVF